MNTPEHAEEDVRALREIGLRSVFLYGASMARKLQEFEGQVENEDSWAHARALRERDFPTDDGLVTFGLAIQGAEVTTIEITRDDVGAARALGVPMACTAARPEGPEPQLSIKRISEAGLLGPDMNFVHCCNDDRRGVPVACRGGRHRDRLPEFDMASGMGRPRRAGCATPGCARRWAPTR